MHSPAHRFDFLTAFMCVADEAPNLSSTEAVKRVGQLADQVRDGLAAVPRDQPMPRNTIAVLRLAFTVAGHIASQIAELRPDVAETDEYASLADALDELDNQIENHEIALRVGPLLAKARSALAVHG
jgi:outer membrane PBP1 activator LpoA protein